MKNRVERLFNTRGVHGKGPLFYLHSKRGLFEKARPIVEDMVSMHPENPIGRQMLGFIQRNKGR